MTSFLFSHLYSEELMNIQGQFGVKFDGSTAVNIAGIVKADFMGTFIWKHQQFCKSWFYDHFYQKH